MKVIWDMTEAGLIDRRVVTKLDRYVDEMRALIAREDEGSQN